ncbi:uncharacterized protein N7482_001035 [Penicillium canariense]|uniref:Uncharacterized protein n=1 Tax=Penicillium canariense TaxID=189055 RepID=A0A9W9LSJ3_9EURO|nr:uncharacterized protein N7482_001035 [Penicillium canariense]KAJ5175158.1 hypothetical protein N7482_001035 [Penicillium canariense]
MQGVKRLATQTNILEGRGANVYCGLGGAWSSREAGWNWLASDLPERASTWGSPWARQQALLVTRASDTAAKGISDTPLLICYFGNLEVGQVGGGYRTLQRE